MTSGGSHKTPSTDQTIDVKAIDLEPTRRGYQITYNYAVRFWLPTLGAVDYATWLALISFCYADKTTCYPSINLLADLAANGNRNTIIGRWRGQGDTRHRQTGALEHLEAHGLLIVQTKSAGPTARHVFHVIKEPPLLTPQQLANLSVRLQQMHTDLLLRCGMDDATYRDLSTSPQQGSAEGIRGSAEGIRGSAQGIRGSAQGTANQYERRTKLEECWREAKSALALKMTEPNFRMYIARTYALAFDATRQTLIIETPDPLTSLSLHGHLHSTIVRTIHDLHLCFDGIPISDVQFQSRR